MHQLCFQTVPPNLKQIPELSILFPVKQMGFLLIADIVFWLRILFVICIVSLYSEICGYINHKLPRVAGTVR